MHYGVEFGIVLQGRMDIFYSDLKIHLSPGDLWFCGMWEPHGWAAAAPFERIILIIWPPALACLRFDQTAQFNWLAPFTVPPPKRPQANIADRRALREIGAKIRDCLKQDMPEIRKWIWLRLYLMEAILLTEKGILESETQDLTPVGSIERLNKVLICFMDSHGMMTTKTAAGLCGMNRNAFSLMFRHLMGLSFADFALRYRLDTAASCLRLTGEAVKNISHNCGFFDTSHFDRLFEKYYGCTPREYRLRKRKSAH